MDLGIAEDRIHAAVLAFPPPTRRALLRVVMAPQDARAEAIGRLYGEPGGRGAAAPVHHHGVSMADFDDLQSNARHGTRARY